MAAIVVSAGAPNNLDIVHGPSDAGRVAGDDDRKSKGPSDFDRMSLNSLKRELEVQKAKTADAREGAQARIADAKQDPRAPWKLILAIVGVGVVVLVVGLFLARNQLATM